MDTIHLPTELKEFLKLLHEHQVDYLLIGGYAVGYYGYPRATGDMDIWIAANQANAQKIMAALEEFGFGDTGMTAGLFVKPDQIVRMGNAPLRIEILTTISGVTFAESFRKGLSTLSTEWQFHYLSRTPDGEQARPGRPKDLADLDNLP